MKNERLVPGIVPFARGLILKNQEALNTKLIYQYSKRVWLWLPYLPGPKTKGTKGTKQHQQILQLSIYSNKKDVRRRIPLRKRESEERFTGQELVKKNVPGVSLGMVAQKGMFSWFGLGALGGFGERRGVRSAWWAPSAG